jgi:hypothetical protein
MEVPNIPSEVFAHLNHRVDYHIYRFISPNASHGGNRNAAGRVVLNGQPRSVLETQC